MVHAWQPEGLENKRVDGGRRRRVVIMGAAGRDFHNFNVVFLNLLSAGRLNPDPIITHHFPLDRIAAAFAAADGKRASGAIRVMVHG